VRREHHLESDQSRANAQDTRLPEGRVSLARLPKSTGEIYRKVGGGIERAKVEIEKEEPLKRQLLSFIECARAGLQPKVSGFEATARWSWR
jgi:hypothetical protein